MKIKFATWNMAHWSHKRYNKKSWEYFSKEVGGDVLLFQESCPNYSVLNEENTTWSEIGGKRPWGSGVYCEKFKTTEFPFSNSLPGAVIATEIEASSDIKFIVISVYGLFEKLAGNSWCMPNLHRMFSDLTEILESSKTRHRVIIAGDLNASIQVDESFGTNSHRVFFDRLREFKLHNCFEGYFDNYVQTHRHPQSTKPWQNDYFFISNRLKKSLKNCEVIVNDKVTKFSDHNPVMIELEI